MADAPNYPIATASLSWIDPGLNIQMRVYSTDGYKVIERVWDNQNRWHTSDFSADGSQVSATVYFVGSSPHIRVYCTAHDKTTEMCQDGGGAWYVGAYTTE